MCGYCCFSSGRKDSRAWFEGGEEHGLKTKRSQASTGAPTKALINNFTPHWTARQIIIGRKMEQPSFKAPASRPRPPASQPSLPALSPAWPGQPGSSA
jgi:hypothetical protein